jgi:hypothetical protein
MRTHTNLSEKSMLTSGLVFTVHEDFNVIRRTLVQGHCLFPCTSDLRITLKSSWTVKTNPDVCSVIGRNRGKFGFLLVLVTPGRARFSLRKPRYLPVQATVVVPVPGTTRYCSSSSNRCIPQRAADQPRQWPFWPDATINHKSNDIINVVIL